ncbi:MAG: transposase [Chitinophagaceae bacterium]
MGITRRKFTADIKKKVVLEALKERNTLQELAAKYEVHPQVITDWKKQFLDNNSAFEQGAVSPKNQDQEKLLELLYAQIGQLKVENDFLKKKLK